MREFKKRRSHRQDIVRFCIGLLGVALLGLLAFGAAHAAWGMYGKFAEAAQSDAEAKQQLAQLQAEQTQVNAQVAALDSSRGVEAQVRQLYGVALPGEGEIDIVRVAASTTAPQATSTNIFVRFWHAINPF